MREALFYEKLENDRVRCTLCATHCRIRPGGRGACRVRVNRGGALITLVADRVVARHVDPIEKKPLFHFLPGHASYSIGTVGCNLRCLHCQNHAISQEPGAWRSRMTDAELEAAAADVPGETITPEEIVRDAVRSGCRSIAYTYNEPTVFFELALETARGAHEAGLANVFVTNGYIEKAALETIAPFLDAANIDLKAFDPRAHQRMTGTRLEPVLENIRRYRRLGIWIEVTTLVIPGHNDSEAGLRAIAEFIHAVDPSIPWHVTRFHPTYRLRDRSATPVSTLRHARRIGLETGLRYVYEGNVPGEEGENTACHACGTELIRRFGLGVQASRIRAGRCPGCRATIPGVFDP